MSIKKNIILLLSEVENGAFSNIILNEHFQKNKYGRKEKAFITEVFYGVLRNKIYIEYCLQTLTREIKKNWLKNLLMISIYQIKFMNSDNAGVVFEAVEISKKKYGVSVSKFINAVLRNYIKTEQKIMEDLEEKKQFDILYSYPKWFCELLEKQYGNDFVDAIKSYKKIPFISFRINKIKYSEQEFENLLEKLNVNIIKKIDSVYYVDSGVLINTEEFKNGKFIAQDASSYLAAKFLDARAFDTVLDTCAAPGSKTTTMSEFMNNQGEIVAIDIHKNRVKLIEENCKKLGINIVKAVTMDAKNVNKQGKKFNKILVDALCSGYGVIRKKPEILFGKQTDIEEISKLQYEILCSAADILKVDGDLVYSTCTITDSENINNVKKFLRNHKNFYVKKICVPENVNGHIDEIGGLVIDYKEEIMDSFYIIKLSKRND